MKRITQQSPQNIENLRNIKFSSYDEYFFFVNDRSKDTKPQMITAGLLVPENNDTRCLNFDEFKNSFQNRVVPQTF